MSSPVVIPAAGAEPAGQARALPAQGAWWVLFVLTVVYMFNLLDRQLINIVGQAVKVDLHLSDLQLGLLGGTMFAFVNVLASFPIARLADRYNRVRILSIAVGAWSALTALCALPQTYIQLLIARMGVGVGEAGGTAPTHSIIADYFPANRRTTALALLIMGVPIGGFIGSAAGGWITEHHGWRLAFLIIGLLGLPLVPLLLFTVKEPLRGRFDAVTHDDTPPPFTAVIRHLLRQRSYLHMLAGSAICIFVGFAMAQFLHPFLVRKYSMGYSEAATAYALMHSSAAVIGYLSVGFLSDHFGARDRRAYPGVIGIGILVSAPLLALGLLQDDWLVSLIVLFVPSMVLGACSAPMYAVTLNLVGARMRASAIALTVGAINFVGYGLGPLFAGWASDFFARANFTMGDFATMCPGGRATAGPAELDLACQVASASGLQTALLILAGVMAWSGIHFMLATLTIRRDLAAAEAGVVAH